MELCAGLRPSHGPPSSVVAFDGRARRPTTSASRFLAKVPPNCLSLQQASAGAKVSNRKLWHHVVEQLKAGAQPVELLESLPQRRSLELWYVVGYLDSRRRFEQALEVFEWWRTKPAYQPREQHFAKFIVIAGKTGKPEAAQRVFDTMVEYGLSSTVVSHTALMQSYAEAGQFEKAEELVQQMLSKGLKPTVVTYNALMHTYAKHRLYDDMAKVFDTMKTVNCEPDMLVYRTLIGAYSQAGLVGPMEKVFNEMMKDSGRPDSASLNSTLQGYAGLGMIQDMERCFSYFRRFKKSPTEQTIRAVALAYTRKNQFHQMAEFAKSVGLRTDFAGNLLWNMMLLSNAANFSMKSLQREAENMRAAGFQPDLTSFNIRALAFSRMQMFWDLHILVLHMQSLGVDPDLVTVGAVVDAYLTGKLENKLAEALDEMQVLEKMPREETDPLVYQAFGKGAFHVFCEDYLNRESELTYSALITCYTQSRDNARRSRDRRFESGGYV